MKKITLPSKKHSVVCFDVAIAPFIVIFGVGGLIAIVAVGLLVWLAVKLIKKAGAKKTDNK